MAPPQLFLAALCLVKLAHSHEHHAHNIPPGEHVSAAPIDSILWLHITIQIATWMLIFPTGMILGIVRSRWHVPVQISGVAMAITAHFLGHAHGGREFRPTIHGQIAKLLTFWLAAQVLCGIYLKLHLQHKYWVQIRGAGLAVHAVLGVGMPLISWLQVVLGGFTAVGFCHGDNARQCVGRTMAGSALIGISIFLLVVLEQERYWLKTLRAVLILVSSGLLLFTDSAYQDHVWRGQLDIVSLGFTWMCVIALAASSEWAFGSQIPRNLVPGLLICVNSWYIALTHSVGAASVLYAAIGVSLQAVGVNHLVTTALSHQNIGASPWNDKVMRLSHFLIAYFMSSAGFLFIGTNKEQVRFLSEGSMSSGAFVLFMHGVSLLLLGSITVMLGVISRHSVSDSTQTEKLQGSDREILGNGFGSASESLPPVENFDLESIISET